MAIRLLKMQRLGRALMLPIAVLPVAGLLLRLGQPDVFNIKMIADAGGAIFRQPAAAVRDRRGGRLCEGQQRRGGSRGCDRLPDRNRGDEGHQRQAQHGRVVGDRGGYRGRAMLYNKYKDIKLPEYLAFFGGKRFVPIVTGVTCLVIGIVFGYVWQPVQACDRHGRPLADDRGRARRVRVRRAEPVAAGHGPASHPQLADVVRVRHVHAAGRRCRGDGRPASLLRGRPDRGHAS